MVVIDAESDSLEFYGVEEAVNNGFEIERFSLRYTPRSMVVWSPRKHSKMLIVLESDCREYAQSKRNVLTQRKDAKSAKGANTKNDEDFEVRQSMIGWPRPLSAREWASCIRSVNPRNGTSAVIQELDENEGAFCMTLCTLGAVSQSVSSSTEYLVIGSAIGMTSKRPSSCTEGRVGIYKFAKTEDETVAIELVAKQSVSGPPRFICPFAGGLLVAMGKRVEFWRFHGEHHRDHHQRHGMNSNDHGALWNDKRFNIEISDRIKSGKFYITKIECYYNEFGGDDDVLNEDGDDDMDGNGAGKESNTPIRFMVSDNVHGFHLFIWNRNRRRMDYVVSSESIHRPLASTLLDAQKLAISNQFGSVFISKINIHRHSGKWSGKALYQQSRFNQLVHFNVNDVISSIEKAKLSAFGRGLILYGTVTGSIGLFLPFVSAADADFCDAVQYYLPSKVQALSGESQLLCSSKSTPSKNCCDSDFCRTLNHLSAVELDSFQRAMAIPMTLCSQKISSLKSSII